jgi:hypothetical protein
MKQSLMAIALTLSLVGYQAMADESAPKARPTSTGNFYTGDAKLVVVSRSPEATVLPQPAQIVLDDFGVPVDAVTVDDSLAARLHRRHLQRAGKDDDSTPQILAQHVQAAFFDGLSAELKKVNVPSHRGVGAAGDGAGSALVVSGAFTAIDEGNEVKRIMIGFGRGASDIKAHVTVSSVTAGRATVVLELDMTSESNKKPGAAVTSEGSLAAGTAEKAIGDRKSKVEADAQRMGKLVAKQVEGLVTEQKWVYSPVPATASTGATANAAASATPRMELTQKQPF